VNDYDKMKLLYEDVYTQSFPPNAKYEPSPASPNYSWGKGQLPLGIAGDDPYARGMLTHGVEVEAEEEIAPKKISNVDILTKVNNLIAQAHEDEMNYAVHMLGLLKEYIKSL